MKKVKLDIITFSFGFNFQMNFNPITSQCDRRVVTKMKINLETKLNKSRD